MTQPMPDSSAVPGAIARAIDLVEENAACLPADAYGLLRQALGEAYAPWCRDEWHYQTPPQRPHCGTCGAGPRPAGVRTHTFAHRADTMARAATNTDNACPDEHQPAHAAGSHPEHCATCSEASKPERTCRICGSASWVPVSLDGGHTRRAQCVPCGAIYPGRLDD